MSRKSLLWALGASFMITACFLSGCVQPDPGFPTLPPTVTFEILPTPTLEWVLTPLPTPVLNCSPDQLNRLETINPSNGSVVDAAQPTFNWSDPNRCALEGYRIRLTYSLDTHGVAEINFSAEVDFPLTSYTLEDWLQLPPGEYITWSVVPIVGHVEGPDGETQDILGPWSREAYFFTGPRCGFSELTAPELYFPVNGEEVPPGLSVLGSEKFIWFDTSDCLPDHYRLQFFIQDPDGEPDQVMDTDEPTNRWRLDQMLEDGTDYAWRVAGVVDGEPGPFSDYGYFTTKEIAAGYPGVITGYVWDDQCENPFPRDDYPADYLLPEGCQIVDGLVLGDGLRYPGESGIPDSVVRVQDGPCPPPEPGSITLTSDDDIFRGEYYVFLPAGTYCVYLDGTDPGNSQFRYGVWTYPEPLGFPMREVVIARDGEVVNGIDFGWDDNDIDLDRYGLVSGLVWFDQNGNGTRDDGEPALPDQFIQIASDGCGEDWNERLLPAFQSSDSGEYQSPNLPPGEYCLIINEQEWSQNPLPLEIDPIIDIPSSHIIDIPTNRLLEIAGTKLYSTSPPGEIEFGGIPFSLEVGELKTLDIGWVIWPLMVDREPTACRSGPGSNYQVIRYYSEGDARYLTGRFGDNSYWVTTDNCWVNGLAVFLYGDPDTLPVNYPPPTPEPEIPDTSPPQVFVSHDPTNPTQTDYVDITANATDDQGVVKISIWTTTFHPIYSLNPVKTCLNTTTCTLTVNPIGPGDSRHYFARAWDAADNQGQSGTGSYTIPH